MIKSDNNEYSLSIIERNLQKQIGDETLEEIVRPMYYKEIVQCTNILDIEYPITALSILGRALDKITKEYCQKVIVDLKMFQFDTDLFTYDKLAEIFWGNNSNLEDRIDLMVGKEISLEGIKVKLKNKIINTADYSVINSIQSIRLDHFNGDTEYNSEDGYNFNVCDDQVIDLEDLAKSYIEPGIKTLFKFDSYLKDLYINLKQKEDLLKEDKLSESALENIKNGIVILECEKTSKQGTAFFVEDIGFITCAHVIGEDTLAFKGDNLNIKYPIELKSKIDAIDLAIIEIPGLNDVKTFKVKAQPKLKVMDEIFVAGYPNYRYGDGCRIVKSQVAAERPVSGIRRLLLDKAIIAGNSGGPALDLDCEHVVGIAVTGDDDITKASKTENNAIIPIDVIYHVLERIKK